MTQRVDEYDFGRMVVRGIEYKADLIILPHRVVDNWWRLESHNLVPEDLTLVEAARPKFLIVGTGAYGVMVVPDATNKYLDALGIQVEVLPTRAAVIRYNELAEAGENVAACFHITC